MKKQSLWLDTVKPPSFPKLQGEVEVDALIVGAGITGITTAYLLKKSGLKIAVVDLQDVGGGETGHTTAHVTFVTDARLSELVSRLGEKKTQALWDAGLAAMNQIEEIAATEKISCDLKRVPAYLFAALDGDAEKERESLEKDAQLARKLSYDCDLLAEDPQFARPALCFPNQLKFHPLKFVAGLARKIPGEGSYIFTKTSGSDIDAEKHLLSTEDGTIKYQFLIAATHVPIQGERGTFGAALFQTKLAGYTSYAIKASIPCVPESLFWDTSDPYYYFRFEHEEGGCSVIIGGEDHKTGQEVDTAACYERLVKMLKRCFPTARPEMQWSGQVIETPDGLPYIGEVAKHQYAATGFSGNGMTLGVFSAMLIGGTKNAWEDLFDPNRKALAGLWDYVRENVDFPTYFVSDRLKPAQSLEEVHRNSGAVVRVDGKKRAVFCDSHGKRTILSPVCPHMGCIVRWNDGDKTWDCPCHGSRFLSTGELMAGPAETGLEKADGAQN